MRFISNYPDLNFIQDGMHINYEPANITEKTLEKL